MKKLSLIFEASEEAIKKFIEDNEEWLAISSSPQERDQRIQYLMKIGRFTSNDENLFANYGNKQNLKNLKLQSKESYGWLNNLSPEEKQKELSDDGLNAEYEHHNNLMKSNFQNPKLTELKIYESRARRFFLKTDNINSILTNNFLKLKEIPKTHVDYERAKNNVSLIFINSKGVIPTDITNSDYVSTITNSSLLFKEKESIGFMDFEIMNSQILTQNKNFSKNRIVSSKIINSKIKAESINLTDSEINNCKLQLQYVSFNVDNAIIENFEIDHNEFRGSLDIEEINIRKDLALIYYKNGENERMPLEQFYKEFAKR